MISIEGNVESFLAILRQETVSMTPTMTETVVKQYGRDPFLILISCLLSLRTKDAVSLAASQRLFFHAKTAQELLSISTSDLEQIIYPVAFYRKRAIQLHQVCHELISHFSGEVPSTEDGLLSLPGVGRKTANLVLSVGFGVPALCVDTHVHRISNRLGLVFTSTPHETEAALKNVIPSKYWGEFNTLLVKWGQHVCLPQIPRCSTCAISTYCKQVGVTKSK